MKGTNGGMIMKKCWTLFLALVLIFSAGTIASSAYEGPPLTQGIDLSQENGSLIDWKLVSYDLRGQFAILCGYDGEILISDDLEWYCPNCGNKDHNTLNVARRTCGYIGSNFWNKGRTQEIKERVLHIDNKDA